jgi:phospholipase/carboxylesterase
VSQPSSMPALPLVHLARPPQVVAAGKPPLLILLHGVRSNERDLFSFAGQLDPRLLVLSVRAPLVRGPEAFAWFDVRFLSDGFQIDASQLSASRDRLIEFIVAAVAAYDADPERVYLLGFSQGAIVSLAAALSTPAAVAGVTALSGRIPPEVVPWIAPAANLVGLPVLVVHGTRDSVIPIGYARNAHEILARLPVAVTYREYEVGHEVSAGALQETLAWLTARLDEPRGAQQARDV